jgi:hypothetical protein
LSYGTWCKLMKNVENCGGDLHTTHKSKSLGLKKTELEQILIKTQNVNVVRM